VQIFATDLDAAMLAEARHARYPMDIADQVSPERLARFFVRDPSNGSGRAADFQAGQELREMCIFSEHSLIRDPPFSQLDLISCRNVLIYLSAELQKRSWYRSSTTRFDPAASCSSVRPRAYPAAPSCSSPRTSGIASSAAKRRSIGPVVEFPLAEPQVPRALRGPRPARKACSSAGPGPRTKDRRRLRTHISRGIRSPPRRSINERGDVLLWPATTQPPRSYPPAP